MRASVAVTIVCLMILSGFLIVSEQAVAAQGGTSNPGNPHDLIDALEDRVDGLEDEIDDLQSQMSAHTHDDRYYTEDEIDTMLEDYLTTEVDPEFTASAAHGITSGDIANWDAAYGWGDHGAVGYLTSESDPIFAAHAAHGITSGDIANWDTAYGWGDHASVGYLTSYTETDPVYGASAAAGIASGDITNWDTAYSWGDHASAGYDTTDDPWSGSDDVYTYGNVGIGTGTPQGPLDVKCPGTQQLDQYQTSYNGGYNTPSYWQSFTPGFTGHMSRLDVFNANLATPTSGYLRIYEGEGTSGTLLYEEPFSFPYGTGWKALDLVDGPLLTGGGKYTMRIDGGPRLGKSGYDTYSGGRASWNAGLDLMFKTYMQPPHTALIVASDGNVGMGTDNPQGALDIDSTTGALIVPRMTTTQRNALTAVNGMIIYNTSTNQFNFYENGAWVTK